MWSAFSLLMGRDDAPRWRGWRAHRERFVDPKITEHGGRIVKTAGDGMLLEFASVDDAVRCAIDVQRGMAEQTMPVCPPNSGSPFASSVNVGDIVIDGIGIFGDGQYYRRRLRRGRTRRDLRHVA